MIEDLLGGLRRNELIALKWPDVNLNKGYFHIRKSISLVEGGQAYEKGTKNDEDRIVCIPEWYNIHSKLNHHYLRQTEIEKSLDLQGFRLMTNTIASSTSKRKSVVSVSF